MKAKWGAVLTVGAILLTSGCSQGSNPVVTPSSSSTLAQGGQMDHAAVYAKAGRYLQSFLDSWQKNGFYAAAQKYFDPSSGTIQKQGNPVLIAGTVTNMQPYAWVSADHFMVQVALDLRFSKGFAEGDSGWGSGSNALFITFARSSASAPYRITLATSPSEPMAQAAVYTQADRYLQSFLDSWQKNGFYSAAQKYFDTSRWSLQKQGNPVLVAGKVKLMQPYAWVSANNFMVLVQLDLRFSKGFSEGDGGWGSGSNDRFFTFVRSSASAPYKMTLATGP